MITRRHFLASTLTTALAGTLPLAVLAQAPAYPRQAVRAVVSNAPGTGTDVTARFISARLAERWGVPVVVENKPGAGGVLATDFVAKSAPDGYTLLFNTSSHFSLPALYDNLSFDAHADFTPVAALAQAPIVMFVPADSPFKTVQDVIAAAKEQPNGITYASPGAGTSSHLAAVMIASQAGVQMLHVPYKSASQAALEVASGQAQVGFNGTGVTLPLLETGRIRMLAVTSLKRSATLPDVPTLDESGFKGYEFVTSVLALVRHGTPADIVQAIGSAMIAAAGTPEFATLCRAQGLDVATQGPAELQVAAPRDFEKWRKLVELAGVPSMR